MESRCQYCAALSISDLVDLAKKEFSNWEMPKRAFYQHHRSLDDLELSANNGCDFCMLILDCFKGTSVNDGDPTWIWRQEWIGRACKLEDSMFSFAKKLPTTDISIHIGASHVPAWETLDDVRVFDNIFINFGPIRDFKDLDAYGPLKLTLTIPWDDQVRVGNYRIGRFPTTADIGSELNFNIARSWLKNCQEKHPTCITYGTSQLPTRVIDVGASEGMRSIRIIHSEGMNGQYIALSHCWGGRISPVLTIETLHQFQESLPFDALPANFRDAIIITRQLGIRYLWIDSLCILQNPHPGSEDHDSKRDWEKECTRMGMYYGNSTLTISALTSERSTQGILKCLDNLPNPRPVKLRVYPDDEHSYEVTVQNIAYEEEETLKDLNENSALAVRGWTFQEGLLSPRQLCYGKRQIYWKCRHGFEAGDGLPSSPDHRTPQFDFHVLSPVLHGNLLSRPRRLVINTEGLLVEYCRLVTIYSTKKLTYKSDKLPAFSSLAQSIHSALPDKCEYLAGLWSHDFLRGLIWHRQSSTAIHSLEYRAPSWSWAVTDDAISYYQPSEFTIVKFNLQLLDWDITFRDPGNPFGETKAGHVIVQGRTVPLIRTQQEVMINDDRKTDIGTASYDETDSDIRPSAISGRDIVFVILKDDGSLIEVRNPMFTELEGLVIDSNAFLPAEHIVLLIGIRRYDEGGENAECLILREVIGENPKAFKRVGHLEITYPTQTYIETWGSQVLRLI